MPPRWSFGYLVVAVYYKHAAPPGLKALRPTFPFSRLPVFDSRLFAQICGWSSPPPRILYFFILLRADSRLSFCFSVFPWVLALNCF